MSLIGKQLTGQTPKGGSMAHGITGAGIARPLLVSDDGTLQTAVSGAGSGGTSSVDEATYTPTTSAGTAVMGARDDAGTDTLAEDKVGIVRATEYRALHVNLRDASGNEVSVGGGTQYTEDAAAAANPVGNALIGVRADTLAGVTSTDGDNVAARMTDKGELYVKHADSVAVTSATFATSAKQDTGNTSLASIDAKITAVNTGAVVVSSSALPSGASTAAKQDTGNTSLATIAGAVAGTEVQVDVLTMPTVTVNSHAVTNAGTFAVQVDGSALTSLQLIDDAIFAEDVASQAADKGVQVLTVRKDTAAATSGTDGDYQPPVSNARGATWVAIEDGAGGQITSFGGGTQYTEDAAAAANPVAPALTLIRDDARGGSLTSTDGDNVAARGTNAGEMYVKHVDAIPVTDNSGSITVDYATTGSGTATGAIRVELPTNGTGVIATVGAVTAITNALPAGTNAIGKLTANSGVDIGDVDVTTVGTITPGTAASSLGKAEDAAHSSGDVGVMALGVSNENSTAFGAASGDYTPNTVNRYGHQYVTAVPPSHVSSNGTPITATTTSVIAAPSAGNHLRIMRIHISNGGATATWVGVRDGAAGTRHYNTYLVQGATISINLNDSGPLDLTTATRLDIFLSAAGSCEYEIDYLTVAD